MNEHLTRILKIVSYVALFFCACWFAYFLTLSVLTFLEA